MLSKYAKTNGFKNIKVYEDDGFTGTNFNRPDMQRLLDDVEMGYISTIIVKDMSRFGREYLQVGYYTEHYFPEKNVRFIAVNDGVDSANEEDNDFTPLRNFMNELYAKDISRKVKSAHRVKGMAGEPLSQPPYGYMKDPENKKKWIIDPEAASVVKDIFKMCLEGKGNETIARILQERQVLIPMAYWQSKGLPRGGKIKQQTLTNGAKQALRRFSLSKNTAVTSLTSKAILYPLRKGNAYQSPKRNGWCSRMYTSRLLTVKPLNRCKKETFLQDEGNPSRKMLLKVSFRICFIVPTAGASCGFTPTPKIRTSTFLVARTM